VTVKFGLLLAYLNPDRWVDTVIEGERVGFESAWCSEHVVFPVRMERSPIPGETHPPVPPTTPAFDAFAVLSHLAALTSTMRLGTSIYLLGLRHPFISARGFATLDRLSEGRAEVGLGVGWLESEWDAVGLDFRTRGARFDEALSVCKRLWTEREIQHSGHFFPFEPVMFEPKPVQRPYPPVTVGGESEVALRRAASNAEGWMGMEHTPETAARAVGRLTQLLADNGRSIEDFTVSVQADVRSLEQALAFEQAGVDRLLIHPWDRSSESIDGIRRFADEVLTVMDSNAVDDG
jgi:probable F420-dependent oxidoreductase